MDQVDFTIDASELPMEYFAETIMYVDENGDPLDEGSWAEDEDGNRLRSDTTVSILGQLLVHAGIPESVLLNVRDIESMDRQAANNIHKLFPWAVSYEEKNLKKWKSPYVDSKVAKELERISREIGASTIRWGTGESPPNDLSTDEIRRNLVEDAKDLLESVGVWVTIEHDFDGSGEW